MLYSATVQDRLIIFGWDSDDCLLYIGAPPPPVTGYWQLLKSLRRSLQNTCHRRGAEVALGEAVVRLDRVLQGHVGLDLEREGLGADEPQDALGARGGGQAAHVRASYVSVT